MGSNIDLHLHTCFSDGTDSPKELITHLRKFGVNTFAVCDHDTVAGCRKAMEIMPSDMKMICGVEFSCRTEFKRCHILGLGIDTENTDISNAVNEAAKLRNAKLFYRLDHLRKTHGIVLSDTDISELQNLNSVGKPHLARILVKDGYSANIDDAIKDYLTFKGNNDRIESELAINAIKSAGGIPVWAHPLGGEGEKRLSKDDFYRQLDLLIADGIEGLECYYSRYTSDEADFLCMAANSHRLFISGGSDYHGGNKTIDPGQLSASDCDISETQLTVLLEL